MSDNVQLSCDNQRQQAQLDFLNSGQELTVGDVSALPLPVDELLTIDEHSPYCVAKFSGLTAYVYQIRVNGRDWNLKRKRDEILVKNVDGQTSFLNEVQRRSDFYRAHQQGQHLAVIPTIYASLQQGFMVSPWIEGAHPTLYTAAIFDSLFRSIVDLEMDGFFEWDYCAGNLLVEGDKVRLYDFGYMWRFDPLTEFNSNGTGDPIFYGIERFETRAFFGYLLNLEAQTPELVMSQFRLEKQAALTHYQRKYAWLVSQKADALILDFNRQLLARWERALADPQALADLYLVESHRSMVLDLMDDLHGQSCTPHTLLKAQKILTNVRHHYATLQRLDGLFFGDETATQAELMAKYQRMYQQAVKFQLV